MPILLDLFLTFLEIGAVSFGGGYGMISILTEKVVGKGWLTSAELNSLIAVAESTPGPIAINMATFVGSKMSGILGSLLSTVGVVLPSFIIILLIVAVFKNLLNLGAVKSFLKGVRPVVIALIVGTGLKMFVETCIGYKIINGISFDYKMPVIFSVNALIYILYKVIKKKSVSPIFLIVISAIFGIIFYGLL